MTRKGALSVTPLRTPPRVGLAGHCPAPLACGEGAAHCTVTLPPLALGGMGGEALRGQSLCMIATTCHPL